MARKQGTLTISGSTGLKTYNLGTSFVPTWAEFKVCERLSGETVAHLSIGSALSSTEQFCMSTFADMSVPDSFNSNAHVIRQYERVGGIVTPVLEASFDSFTATGIKLNATIVNNNYQVLVTVGN